jgi:Ion channel
MAEATGIAAPAADSARGRRIGPEHRYGLLLVATIVLLGVQGMVPPSPVQEVAVTALAGVSLVLAFRAAGLSGRLILYAAAVAGAVIVVSTIRATAGGVSDGTLAVMNAAVVALGPPAVAGGVLRDLRATGQVRIQAVMGVLSLYILLGMFFAFLYGAIDRLGGDPFFANGNTATTSHCLYFSFTTLTTVGYGDYVARTDTGHTLAVFEALLGQIYLVTVVSLIVSNLGRGPMRRSDEA